MSGLVAPVKGIINSIKEASRIAKGVAESATSAPAAHATQIIESARTLQTSLELSSKAINDTYRRNAELYGERFTKALVENEPIQNQLKLLRSALIEQTDKCQDFEEEPETFDAQAFRAVQEQAERCLTECIHIFNRVQDQLVQARGTVDEARKDDRSQLTSMKPPSMRKPVPRTSQSSQSSQSNSPALSTSLSSVKTYPEPKRPSDAWTIDSPSQFDLGAQSSSPVTTPSRNSREISHSSKPDTAPHFIPKSIIQSRLSANEEFLDRRRRSRIEFHSDFRKSIASVSSVEENRASIAFSDGLPVTSPLLGSPLVTSPIDRRSSRGSLNGYDVMMTRQRSQGHASVGTRSSRTDSIIMDQHPVQERRTYRQDSEDSIFGLRNATCSSPPLDDARSSGSDQMGSPPLATTLRVPGFGNGVQDGLEAVPKSDYSDEKMVVPSNHIPHPSTPPASVKTVGYPIRHDSSFYKFGGFCEGARATIRGSAGYKIVKRPSGQYSSIISARCIKCSYELGWNDVEKDQTLDPTGIYGSSGIRWRQRFLSKCHVKTHSVEEPIYACIFCIEDCKSVEEHDSTVFFSVSQLFRHLAKHPRPLSQVSGITTLYGHVDPSAVDFDLHFVSMEPKPSIYSMAELAQKVTTRPAATAIVTHHPKNARSNSRDPEGNFTLHFAAGARILGITFPERFAGNWCIGYHDGERGPFPSTSVALDLPAKELVLMSPQSSLIAFARWNFKPKDAKEGGWLKFNKGDKITCIGYSFQDQWCWSGQTTKGKWGLFPAAFVEGLQDGDRMATSPGSSSLKGGLGLGRITSFGRRSSGSANAGSGSSPGKHDVLASVREVAARASPGSQPGLEVVPNSGSIAPRR